MVYDVIIIGNGPAGLSAAIYARRAGLSAIMLSDNPMPGGQIATTYEIENYPGLGKLSGAELGMKMSEDAKTFGVETATTRVLSIVKETNVLVKTDHEDYEGRTAVIATGATHRHLGVPGEEEHAGMGVSYCATCDGAFFRNRTVAVVGGGDVALEDAIFLSRFATKVYLIHRRDEFRGAKVLQDQVRAIDKIEICYDTVVEEVLGEDVVRGIVTKNVKSNNTAKIELDGVFMAVGIRPNLDGIEGLPQQDETGYIVAGEDCVTSIPGIYAAGDVRTKQLRQVVTAVADGANAITSIQQYLIASV